jgi:hypothetical protein
MRALIEMTKGEYSEIKKEEYLTNDLLDPDSKEPDYNHNAAKLQKWTK